MCGVVRDLLWLLSRPANDSHRLLKPDTKCFRALMLQVFKVLMTKNGRLHGRAVTCVFQRASHCCNNTVHFPQPLPQYHFRASRPVAAFVTDFHVETQPSRGQQ